MVGLHMCSPEIGAGFITTSKEGCAAGRRLAGELSRPIIARSLCPSQVFIRGLPIEHLAPPTNAKASGSYHRTSTSRITPGAHQKSPTWLSPDALSLYLGRHASAHRFVSLPCQWVLARNRKLFRPNKPRTSISFAPLNLNLVSRTASVSVPSEC